MELLKIKATDAEDMEVMSLCLQDAALQVADITWRPGGSGRTGRFGFNVQRLCHEKKKQGLMRVNCRFWVDGVVEAKHRTDVQDMLSLVLLAIVPQEDGLILHFNDNKVIKLIAPKWHAYLEDFGVHWPADKASPHAE